MVKSAKQKGSAAERELQSMFWGSNWACLRVAGSGSSQFPCMDLMAGNGSKSFAVECKSTKYDKQYFRPDQIKQLNYFANLFGAEALIAVKFSAEWKFFKPSDLKATKKGFVINKNHKNAKYFSDISKLQSVS